MLVALIADAHIGGPGGSAGPLIGQLLGLAERQCRHLVILGDLFHIWVGHEGYETTEIEEVLHVLRGLRGQGLRIDYVEGNRDFFLRGGIYAREFDRVGEEISFEVDGLRCLCIHGDTINPKDWKYRCWRFLSKNRLNRLFTAALPRRLARAGIHWTERRLARMNFEHKHHIPEEVICDYAERRLAEGFDVLLLGHFHAARRWRIRNGEVRLVDAWFQSRRVEWIGADPSRLAADLSGSSSSASHLEEPTPAV